MEVYGKIVEVEIDTLIKKRDGGTYPGSRIIFKDDSGNIKDKAFHSNTFKYNEPLATQIKSLSPGDNFVMVQEKNGEYWNVIEVRKVEGKAKAATSKTTTNNSVDWDKKQDLIIRQNVLGNSIKYYSEIVKDKKPVPLDIIFETAKLMEEYVNSGQVPSINISGDVSEMENDIPF